jgi:hypothetical protein
MGLVYYFASETNASVPPCRIVASVIIHQVFLKGSMGIVNLIF